MKYFIRYWDSKLGRTVDELGGDEEVINLKSSYLVSNLRVWELETNDLKPVDVDDILLANDIYLR